jgi:hypothetical protein
MSKGTLKEFKIFGGLTEYVEDNNDFKLGAIVTLPKLETIPDDFTVWNPPYIKDQKETDFCTAFAGTYASAAQEGVDLSPEFQFAATKKISGDISEWGADMRDMLKSLCEIGSIESQMVPNELKIDSEGSDRDTIANIANWPESFKQKAIEHKKRSYFKVTGPYDLFDNMRATMFAFSKENRLVITGAKWKHAWTVANGAIIPKEITDGGFGHAFVFNGTKKIDGEIYLKAILSNGSDFGDGGFYYFPREVVNRDFRWGGYTLIDISKEDAHILIDRKMKLNLLWLAKVLQKLINLFK